jgi:hypothetical protein
MNKNRNRVILRLTKAQRLLVCCAAVLVLGWMLTGSRDDLAIAGSFPERTLPAASIGVLNLQVEPKGTIEVAQRGGAPSKKPIQDSVIINGVSLNDDKVRALEKQYGIRILNGDYWYDKVSGAWGLRGGPAVGLILPLLDLGGSLQPNASNGNTGVFINGRELHILDVLALQKITPVFKGRYWVDAWANIGFEGGPALVNLWTLANSRGVRREGILSTYDKTGAVVIGN